MVQTRQCFDKIGEPTEAALITLVEKMNVQQVRREGLEKRSLAMACSHKIQMQFQKLLTLEFSRDRKSMSVYVLPVGSAENGNGTSGSEGDETASSSSRLSSSRSPNSPGVLTRRQAKLMAQMVADSSTSPQHQHGGDSLVSVGSARMYVKGAPESVLERCTSVRVAGQRTVPLSAELRTKILARVQQYSAGSEALRCLALATVDKPISIDQMVLEDPKNFASYETNMCFVGVVAMLDPPRLEVCSCSFSFSCRACITRTRLVSSLIQLYSYCTCECSLLREQSIEPRVRISLLLCNLLHFAIHFAI